MGFLHCVVCYATAMYVIAFFMNSDSVIQVSATEAIWNKGNRMSIFYMKFIRAMNIWTLI